MINSNANTPGLLSANSSLLELTKGESTTFAKLAVVLNSLATDGRSEGVQRADTKGSGLDLPSVASAKFASWLIEPGADAALPVLAEMIAVEDWTIIRILDLDSPSKRSSPLLCAKPMA